MLVKLYELPDLATTMQEMAAQLVTIRPALAPELHIVTAVSYTHLTLPTKRIV